MTVSSVSGAPGATSWALLLAAAWPGGTEEPDRVVLEADCDGGVLGARYGLGVEPGAVALISACRRSDLPLVVEDIGRPLADGVWAVPGPEVAEQARPVWTSGAADVADRLATDHRWWIVDGGRLRPGSPLSAMPAAADFNLVVSRPSLAALVQLPARLEAMRGLTGREARSDHPTEGPPVGIVVVGRPDHSSDDVRAFLHPAPCWIVPAHDDLPAFTLGAVRGGRARRNLVWRAALDVAAEIAVLAGLGGPRPGGPGAVGSAPGWGDGEPTGEGQGRGFHDHRRDDNGSDDPDGSHDDVSSDDGVSDDGLGWPGTPVSPAMEAALASTRRQRR